MSGVRWELGTVDKKGKMFVECAVCIVEVQEVEADFHVVTIKKSRDTLKNRP